jgi:molecular chaperone DnaK (HSP70)
MEIPPPYEAVPKDTGSGSTPLDNRFKIIVGLDYGTTNSGISYVTSDQKEADKIEVIRQWPNGPGTIGKVPSVIAYKNENTEDELTDDQWGFGTAGLKSYLWTKLLLGKDSRTTLSRESDLKELYGKGFCTLPEGKTAKEVVTDYLRHLYNYLLERLKRHDDRTYRITPMEFWITVPAMWTDAAKAATIEAAQAAGFGSRQMDSIHIITEPEAAALAVLMPRVGFGAVTGLEGGPQNILICDCGGGTVDIVTYKVEMKDGKLEFQELLVGVGEMCGSTFIDRNFHEWMTKKFGDAYTNVDSDMRGPGSNFFKQFENAKRNFSGPSHSKRIDVWPINMSAPKSSYYDKRNFTVRLQASDMLELFDPPISQIVKLVESQADAATKRGENIDQVVLVGGFGDSPYLNLRLKEWCSSRDINLSCPPACQEAIVKGAALRGLSSLVPTTRLARRHYGYSGSNLFREGIDDERDGWVSDWDNRKWCKNRMTWFLNKGDAIDDFQRKSFNQFTTFYANSTNLAVSIDVWTCDQEVQPETTHHWSMQKLGKLDPWCCSFHGRELLTFTQEL